MPFIILNKTTGGMLGTTVERVLKPYILPDHAAVDAKIRELLNKNPLETYEVFVLMNTYSAKVEVTKS